MSARLPSSEGLTGAGIFASKMLLAGGLGSTPHSSGLLICLQDQGTGFLQNKWSKKEQDRSHNALYSLHLQMTHCHFCKILLVTQFILLSVGRDCTVVWVPIGKNHWGQGGGWLPRIILSESYIAKLCIFGWILKSKEVAFNSLTWKRETGAKRKLVYWNGWYHGAISRKINIL